MPGILLVIPILGVAALIVAVRLLWPSPPASAAVVTLASSQEDAWLATAFSELLNAELRAHGRMRVLDRDKVDTTERALSFAGGIPSGTCESWRRQLAADFLIGGEITAQPEVLWVRLWWLDLATCETGQAGEVEVTVKDGRDLAEERARVLDELAQVAGAAVRDAAGIPHRETVGSERFWAAELPAPSWVRPWAEGLERRRAGDLTSAAAFLERASAPGNDSPAPFAELARARAGLGQERSAVEAAATARARLDRLPRRRAAEIEVKLRAALGQWREASAIYVLLRRESPLEIEHGLRWVEALLETEDRATAGAELQRLAELIELGEMPASELDREVLATLMARAGVEHRPKS